MFAMSQEIKLAESYTDGTCNNNVLYSIVYKLITQVLYICILFVTFNFYIYLFIVIDSGLYNKSLHRGSHTCGMRVEAERQDSWIVAKWSH